VKWCKRLPDIIYPQESPSIINGKRFALAKYNAAVCPAGPEPITDIGSWFYSFFAPGVNISVTQTK
jgi:hypothetical protein